jgi:hypothetical protein
MDMHKQSFLYLLSGLLAILNGCIFFPSFLHTGYGGEVIADIAPQAREPIDASLLRLRDFKGPHKVAGGDPRRKYYTTYVLKGHATISFNLYFGPLQELPTGWAIQYT